MFLCMDEAEDEKYDLRKGLVRVREKERERGDDVVKRNAREATLF